jgi:hypothetical protein
VTISSSSALVISMTLAVMATLLHAQQSTPGRGIHDGRPAANAPLTSTDVAKPHGLPEIGKWMIDRDGTVAHWLGEIYEGKHLHEPINVILVDTGAASADHARQRLVEATHSGGISDPLRSFRRISRLYRG